MCCLCRILEKIKRLQNLMVNYDIIKKLMPLVAREDKQFGREVFVLCYVLLFNANSRTQVNDLS